MKVPITALLLSLTALNAPARAETPKLSLQQVAPGIYVHQGAHELPNQHNRGEIANIGFIIGQRCVAVIDTGGSPEQGYALKRAIESTTTIPICYVINTHVHPDHIYGNLAFKQPGVSFIGHRKLAEAMAMRAPFYQEKAERDLGFALKNENFVPPDRPVQDTLELDLGSRTLLLKAHKTAHTDNDLSIYDSQTKTFWLADLLFMGHLPVVDGSLNGWLATLEQIKTLDAKLAIPGHGPVSADWPKALEPEERYLKTLQSEIRAFIKDGKTMEEAMAKVGLTARDNWQLFDEFHKKNVSTAFAELEWEGD
ncbi:quinoprotein relay system zinc metallohydrolase 2 [Methylocaldum sp.]|uniref:quinoprotein relay system zinc metallohydrolase 2 n=1 Tax=Methylocaldum sp. TaxID=1969727 RepID=UPI002D70E25B|nr:quinoprotein relay system zinc metallohydrolase 2 [Methylocaldum sp.]HYE36039.1 quinoprotein relay system zinc metallohydrolase 2 [Methylocaldum sp.]